MSYSTMFYFANVLPYFANTLIFFIGVCVLSAVVTLAYYMDQLDTLRKRVPEVFKSDYKKSEWLKELREERKRLSWWFRGSVACIFGALFLSFVSLAIPSTKTLYLVMGVNAVETTAKTPEAQAFVKDLFSKIRQEMGLNTITDAVVNQINHTGDNINGGINDVKSKTKELLDNPETKER